MARLAGLSPFALWSSPSIRCATVAAAIAAAYGVSCRHDDRLLELDFGAWEGIAWADVPRAELDRWAASPAGFAAPGGESGAALIARVSAFHADVKGLEGAHVVVTHGGPLRLLTALAHGWRLNLLAATPALGSMSVIYDPRTAGRSYDAPSSIPARANP